VPRRLDSSSASTFLGRMSKLRSRTSTKKKPVSPVRSWRASLIRKRSQVLGDVDAPSREAPEAAAVRAFNLNEQQRSRLVVQERE
jgi:hypothetical protein